jgi:hypothetical protein
VRGPAPLLSPSQRRNQRANVVASGTRTQPNRRRMPRAPSSGTSSMTPPL